jgi:hypothetical protein
MHRIDLSPPIVDGQKVTFRWRVEPATTLYRKTQFTLMFPRSVDLSRVPERLWWDILFLCLHPHWLLLRPCRIHLPLKLSAPERQFWLQFLQNGADALAVNRNEPLQSDRLGITFICGDLILPRTPISGMGCGTSFSAGKDSLLQAGLLCELSELPLLVTTTSPLPHLVDHLTERRRAVLAAIQARRNIRFVEVVSDFRGITDNDFAGHLGYLIAVSEMTDTFLYMSNLLAAGAALGTTRLFLASEAEVQGSAILDGKIVQHRHFMYSAATQRALQRLLAAYGIQFGSLIWPLYSMQVQQLLWARYPDICDLQYSCWQMQLGEATCSQCEQCFRIAVTALVSGENPERMGINLPKVLACGPNYGPLANKPPVTPILPQDHEANRAEAYVVDSVGRISLLHLARVLARGKVRRLMSRDTRQLLREFRRLQMRARQFPKLPRLGVREAFFEWLDSELREKLIAIFTHHFPREPHRQHLGEYERSRALTIRVTSFLD